MKTLFYLLIITIFSSANEFRNGCTIFTVQDNKKILVGNNEDAQNSNSKMWIVPTREGEYGRICFGFDKDFKIAEGGMNDHGLFIDVNALKEKTGWAPAEDKLDWEEWSGWFGTGVPDGILAKCANVEEALRIFREYNLLTFANVKYLLADKTGDSAVVEWSRKGLNIKKGKSLNSAKGSSCSKGNKTYQISTNFVASDFRPDDSPCERYKIAERMLKKGSDTPSVDLARAVLSATSFEFNLSTQYSNIYDLKTGVVYIYLYHNFEEPLKIDLAKELTKGSAKYNLYDRFDVKSYSYELYRDYYKR